MSEDGQENVLCWGIQHQLLKCYSSGYTLYVLVNQVFLFNSDIPKAPKSEPPVPETKEISPERNSKKEREKEKEKTRQRSPTRSKSRSRSRSRSPSHSRPRRHHRSRSRQGFNLPRWQRLRTECFLLELPFNVMISVEVIVFLVMLSCECFGPDENDVFNE